MTLSQIANTCKTLQNFNSLFAIMVALQANVVCNLKQAWEKVPKDSMKLYDRLVELTANDRNMKVCQ